MYTTSAERTVTTAACYSLIVVGAFDDLDTMARLITSQNRTDHLHVAMMQYPVGWRLQVTATRDADFDHARRLVEQHIKAGMPIQIANRDLMPTYLYTSLD